MDTWVCCIGNVGEVCLRKGWGENLQGKLRSIKLPINHERLLLNVINRAAHKMLEFLIKHKVWFFINKKHLKRRRQRHTHRSSATHLSLSLSLSLASGWRKQNNYAPTHPHRYRNTDTQETHTRVYGTQETECISVCGRPLCRHFTTAGHRAPEYIRHQAGVEAALRTYNMTLQLWAQSSVASTHWLIKNWMPPVWTILRGRE